MILILINGLVWREVLTIISRCMRQKITNGMLCISLRRI
jgi:hypothetical protein